MSFLSRGKRTVAVVVEAVSEVAVVPDSTPVPVPAGRYRLLSEVGRGSSGVVYRGLDVQLGRPIAIKVFHLSSASPEQLGRQQAELEVLASLNHPGIVTLYDSGTDLSNPERPQGYLVMELVVGTDLQQILERGPLPVRQITDLAIDLFSALQYMHEHGVIHRDIKPSNILMVTGEGDARMHAKLSDFGTALTSTSSLVESASSGTAAYLSPEQAAGDIVQSASDVFSLGLVLLQCFTGTLAYPGSAATAKLAAIESAPHIPEGIDPVWRELLVSMTKRLPEDRPAVPQLVARISDRRPAGQGRHRISG